MVRVSVEATGACVQSGYVGPSVDGYWQTPQRDLSLLARVGWRSMADHNLAGDFAACVMAPTDLGVIEGKYGVDDRPDLVLFHGPAQVLEAVTAFGGRSWSGTDGLPWSTATVCTCVIASVRPIPVRSSGEPCWIFGRSSHQFWRGAV